MATRDANRFALVHALRDGTALVDGAKDTGTSGLLDGRTDQAEQRA
jgi:hypothetical protein